MHTLGKSHQLAYQVVDIQTMNALTVYKKVMTDKRLGVRVVYSLMSVPCIMYYCTITMYMWIKVNAHQNIKEKVT